METKNEGYKGYAIFVVPKYKRNTNVLGVSITITKLAGGKLQERVFVPDDQFVDEQEALDRGIQLGKNIIDGVFPTAKLEF